MAFRKLGRQELAITGVLPMSPMKLARICGRASAAATEVLCFEVSRPTKISPISRTALLQASYEMT